MTRVLLGALLVGTALVLSPTVIARLPLPGSPPDLLLVVVLAYALAQGPRSGMLTGFVGGALADLTSDHQLGRLALAYVVAGWAVGLAAGQPGRSLWRPFVVVGAGAAGALLVYAGEGLLLGDPRIRLAGLATGLVSSVPYDVVLVPFVVPLVALLVRGAEVDPARRAAYR